MKNKKGGIPIQYLVLGVLVLCLFALVSFLISSNQTQKNVPNLEVFENLTSGLQSFYYYLDAGYSKTDAASLVGGKILNNKLVLNANDGKVLNATYTIDLNK